MLNINSAVTEVKNSFPDVIIKKGLEYHGTFVFLVQPKDLDEFPIFVAINSKTKEVSDLAFDEIEDPMEFQSMFLTAKEF